MSEQELAVGPQGEKVRLLCVGDWEGIPGAAWGLRKPKRSPWQRGEPKQRPGRETCEFWAWLAGGESRWNIKAIPRVGGVLK